MIVGLVIKLGLLYTLLFRNLALTLEVWAVQTAPNSFTAWLLFFFALGAISWALGLPASIGHQQIERKFELSKQTWKSWSIDGLKGILIGGVLGTIVLGALNALVHSLGASWWLGAWFFFLCFSVLLAQLAPVLFLKMFYELKPMEAGPLKEKLIAQSKKHGLSISEVYSWGLGAKTERGNAAFTGLGRTKRIIIGDTLYQKFSSSEVEAVFAHELGHQVHNDLWKGIFVSSLVSFVIFAVAAQLEPMVTRYFGVPFASPYWLFLFFMVFAFLQMPSSVLLAAFSRWREWQADAFAAKDPHLKSELGNALERLTYQNRGRFKPNAIIEFLTYSHPAPWRRITALRQS